MVMAVVVVMMTVEVMVVRLSFNTWSFRGFGVKASVILFPAYYWNLLCF